MLKERIITALILVSALMFALFNSQLFFWQALINIIILIGFWEWLRFCKLTNKVLQLAAYGLFILAVSVLQLCSIPLSIVVPTVCVLWVFLFIFTLSDRLNFLHHPSLKLLIGIVILSVAGVLLIELKQLENGPLWILCFLVCVWAADIGAYFVGRRYGKTKLAPKVSPGKTVEGLLGGVVFALLIFIPATHYYLKTQDAWFLLVVIIVTVLVSVMGDLFESKQKRYADIKDSSQILPGHGGILDRIDSLLSGAPYFVLGLMLLDYWQ